MTLVNVKIVGTMMEPTQPVRNVQINMQNVQVKPMVLYVKVIIDLL